MKSEQQFVFDLFRLDMANERLWRGEEALALTPKAFGMLHYLVEHPERLITKEELLDAVWPGIAVGEAVLKVCVRELRKALGDNPKAPQFIETAHRRGYRFIAPLTSTQPVQRLAFSVQSPSPAPNPQHPAPAVVGRVAELEQLQGWLEKALRGERQVVFVTGEAGIGKTTLVEAFVARAAAAHDFLIARGQCVEHYGAGEAYLPVLEALGRLCRAPRGEQITALLRRYAPTWLVQLPWLLSPVERDELQRAIFGATQERMLREMAEALEALTTAILLMLVLEDLQWSDYATLDLISSLARRREPARLLVIGTYRPVDVIVSRHPLKAVKQELEVHGQCAELPLELLTAADVAAYLRGRFAGETQPTVPVQELAQLIHQRTDGNPLFMVNVADSLVAQGIIREQEGRWQLQAGLEAVEVGVPESLRQLIEQQVEHLPQEEQQVLEAASVVGAEFSAAAAVAALEADREQIEARCEGLARRGQFLRSLGVGEWPDGTVTARYGFAHALYQNVVYRRVAATRCMRLHQRIGERMEAAYGNQVGQVAAELAVHFERGRDYRRAVQYLEQAGQRAAERSANVEAIAHLTKGLELLTSLPDTLERTQQELGLQTTIGPALQAIKGLGAPEVVRAYTRARELCQQVGETPQLFTTLWGLFLAHTVRGEIPQALELINELLRMAQQQGDPDLLLQAHHAAWGTMTWLGEHASAITHAEQGIAIYSPEKHRLHAMRYGGHDPGVCGHAQGALALWLRGYGDQAMAHSQQALDLAQHLSHPPSLVHALTWRLWLHQFRREPNAVREWVDAMVAVATEQGLAQSLLFATLLRGWALSMGGHTEEGIAPLRAGVEKYQSMGAAMMVGYFKALLAEAYSRAGLAAQGLSELDGALECAKRTGERFWEAEIHRLRGELLLQSRTQSSESEVQEEAAACFHQAINVARRQSAKSLELRAVMSLARLWHRQGKRTAARQMLAEIYGWFTEGFETKDLQDATALLKELESQEGERQRGNRGSRHRTTVQTVRKRTRDKRLAR